MLISIIIPVYNVEKYLEQCVMSFIMQIDNNKRGDVEIILVDDGSTDKSGRLCDELMKKYPNIIKSFHKKNEGLLMTRRYGYKVSRGMYIINCDSDDFVETNLISSSALYAAILIVNIFSIIHLLRTLYSYFISQI